MARFLRVSLCIVRSKGYSPRVPYGGALLLLAFVSVIPALLFAADAPDLEELDRLSHGGTRWLTEYLRTGDNLRENEGNFLTFLTGLADCARNHRLRREARDEAIRVASELLTPPEEFLKRFHGDLYLLADYLGLFQRLGVLDSRVAAGIRGTIVARGEEIRESFSELGSRELDSEELYDKMLQAYHLTVLKQRFPTDDSLARLPDLEDFLEILADYRYAFEYQHEINPEALDEDATQAIQSDLYNVTHVFYVFGDYRSIAGGEAFFQRELAYIDRLKPFVASLINKDIDLTAEIIEILLASGYSKDDPFIRAQWNRILSHPRRGDQWLPPWTRDPQEDPVEFVYNQIHTTWAITDLLAKNDCPGAIPFYPPLILPLKKYASLFDPETGRMTTAPSWANDELRRLDVLIGEWNTATRLWKDGPDSPPVEYRGRASRHWVLGRRFLQQRGEATSAGRTFNHLAYVGYDRHRGLYQYLRMADSATHVSLQIGRPDPSAYALLRATGTDKNPRTGYAILTTTEIAVSSPDRHVLVEYAQPEDGRTYKRLETVFTRRNQD